MVIEYFLEWVDTATVAKRAEAAGALVRAFLRKDITSEERDDLEAAITTLLEDPAPSVRLALAKSLGAWKQAPRHVTSTLAADATEIAVICLSQSPVFHDAELVSIIKASETEKQIAIACRPWLSVPVMAAICKLGCEEACLGLLMNPASRFNQDNLHDIAERFGASTDIRLILLDREDLGAETRLLLITKLGDALSGLVSSRGWMQESRVENAVKEACDKASITLAAGVHNGDVTSLVRSMISSGRITVSYLMRAVCMGNITLVAQALSELSNVSFSRVETILAKDQKSAFKAVYDRAGLPQSAFVIFQTAISAWRRLLSSGSEINQARLPFLVTREVLEAYSGQRDAVIDDLIVLLRKLSAETARESAKAKAEEIANRPVFMDEEVEIITQEPEVTELDQIDIDLDLLVEEFAREIALEVADVETFVETVEAVNTKAVPQIYASDIYEFGETAYEYDDDIIDVSDVLLNAPVARAA